MARRLATSSAAPRSVAGGYPPANAPAKPLLGGSTGGSTGEQSGEQSTDRCICRINIPTRIKSTPNLREHWTSRARRNSSQRHQAWYACLGSDSARQLAAALPLRVTLVRVAPRALDDDNMAAGCKAVRDGIADWLGVADNDPRVEWCYRQRRGAARLYTAFAEFETLTAVCR